MEFRWIALISLWTLLAGPIFDLGIPAGKSRDPQRALAAPARVNVDK